MSSKVNLVTGATGLLGSHVVAHLAARGERVRALVRANSDIAFLQECGAELVVADLSQPASLPRAVAGADIVYHCAARVSDWGPWRLFQETIIDTTRHLLDACHDVGVGRFLHVSSSRVYGHPPHVAAPIAEDEPLGQHPWLWDYYPRAKIETETLCRQYRFAWTIVRPTWLYGPRDRNTLPRILRTLELGQVALIGSGDNPLPFLYAGDAADGVIQAANHPEAIGQVYNLSAEDSFTQREFFMALTTALGLPALRRHVPYRLAYTTGLMVEIVGKLLGVRRNLRITRHGVSLLARSPRLSNVRARVQLGWASQVLPRDGIARTIAWYLAQRPFKGQRASGGLLRALRLFRADS